MNGVSRLEFALSGLLGLLSVVGLVLPYTSSSYGHGDGGAFAFLIGVSLAPVAVALAGAAYALHRGTKASWLWQGLPLGVVAGLVVFFWWAQ